VGNQRGSRKKKPTPTKGILQDMKEVHESDGEGVFQSEGMGLPILRSGVCKEL